MKFVLASYGSRGDIEPCAAVGRELLRRGHEVHMAVPPNLVALVESVGLEAVAYGPDSRPAVERDFARNLWKDFPRGFRAMQDLIELWRETRERFTESWNEMSSTLASLAKGADMLISGMIFEQQAAHVAEYYNIPLASLHYLPVRANGCSIPGLPPPLVRSAITMYEWVHWRETKKVEDAQRRDLGLAKATGPTPRRIAERGWLEIQAYDEVCFPGLAAEWKGRRPFVGTPTLELSTDADDELASWIAAGTPPIYFGFGSMPVRSPADTLAMISTACAQLGERALICCGWSDFSHLPHLDHVKVVGLVNFAKTFPACRAVVHHGGLGSTAAALRAGVPTLILWTMPDQQIWGAQIKRLQVGTARRFSATTRESLVSDLRRILSPHCVTRVREVAPQMTQPAASSARVADLVEEKASLRLVG